MGVKERCQVSKMCFGTGNTYFIYMKRELLGSWPKPGTLYVTGNFQKRNVVLKDLIAGFVHIGFSGVPLVA